MQAPDLSAAAAKARTQAPPPQDTAPDLVEATVAYIVYVRKDNGQFTLTNDINIPLAVDRSPTHDEVYASMQVIMKDIVGQQYAGMSAQAVLQLNNYVAGQLRQQQDAEALMREMAARNG